MADDYALDSSDDYSSDDEAQTDLKKKKSISKISQDNLSEFEKEMQLKLNEKLALLQESQDFKEPVSKKDSENISSEPAGPQASSSSFINIDEGENLYDPEEDDKNAAWLQKSRRKYQVKGETKPPTSDAILNCPGCFTTLCHDCQRHETYQYQYRAMFTSHCVVDMSQTLKYPFKGDKNKTRKRTLDGDSDSTTSTEEVYHPVRCEVCNTQVAVYDNDEVYHFFNVLASH